MDGLGRRLSLRPLPCCPELWTLLHLAGFCSKKMQLSEYLRPPMCQALFAVSFMRH